VVVEPLVRGEFPKSLSIGSPIHRNFRSEYHSATECPEELPDAAQPVAVSTGTTMADVEVGDVRFALVVDDTGSMSEEIGGVRTALQAFITAIDLVPFLDFPPTALVTFKDGVTVRLVSDDADELRAAVASLEATGGEDCPESSNAALLTAGRMLAPLGVAILFTDADSRSDGPSRELVVDLYRSRGLLLSTLLTGSCTGAASIAPSYAPLFDPDEQGFVPPRMAQRQVPYCPPDGGGFALGSTLPPDETLGPESGLVTFSSLTAATGGMFAFFETVDQSYENVIRNVATASVAPAVGLVTPREAAAGSVLDVEIRGGNTNFAAGRSQVSIAGGDVTVSGVRVLSPTLVTATLTIAGGAVPGFRDVRVVTDLVGAEEEAVGFGALAIVSPAAGPRITSVVPSTAVPGEAVTATVSTTGLDLAAAPLTLSFGAGVAVDAVRPLADGQLEADITVAAEAAPGFRTVRVTTAGGAATSTAAFLVVPLVLGVPVITEVTPSSAARGETLTVTLIGADTTFTAGVSSVSFGGGGIVVGAVDVMSPTLMTAEITVETDATPGFRDVQVTTGDEIAAALDAFEVTAPAAAILEIPTLSDIGLLLMALILGGFALRRIVA
jgi:hypothetical protein